jgi:methyltransferase (TIGR00027 family)
MSKSTPLIRDVSDTARWVAVYRANESQRRDALFRDPFADRLAGERGREIVRTLPRGRDAEWGMVVRTVLFDEAITRALASGCDFVVNLAAGFDARPYRLDLPASLRWIEADLPALIEEKERLLAGEKPRCRLERFAVNLADPKARNAFFDQVASRGERGLVLSEGLVTYLTARQVEELARDLHARPSLHWWVVDFGSPLAVRQLQRTWGKALRNAPFRFAPKNGIEFFRPCGWTPLAFHALMPSARRLRREMPHAWRIRLVMKLLPKFLRRRIEGMGGVGVLGRT